MRHYRFFWLDGWVDDLFAEFVTPWIMFLHRAGFLDGTHYRWEEVEVKNG